MLTDGVIVSAAGGFAHVPNRVVGISEPNKISRACLNFASY